ncbi:SGNH/GDSL hydrolase family protein [Rossellomorea sp. NS-SX7]|uniref:SGNH/GDSL hydrolase family protein n=1 Tax=Rossellomorea sp. NS-SX7 TaxID=3463856 RepID=UPI004059D580
MKNVLLVVFAIICISLLIIGNRYWQERITGSPSAPAASNVTKEAAVNYNEDVQGDALITNWPVNAQEHFKEQMKNGKVYKIALVGSSALGSEEDGWSEQLAEKLSSAFEDKVEVTIFQSDTTSVQFIDSEMYESVLAFQPGLVLFEPFTLNDNSIGVPYERNQESILIFYEDLKEKNNRVELILQPSYPIAGATYYPKQVEYLKVFAEENAFTYLDHWKEWPEEEALDEYLLPSQESPNEEGHELWAGYLADYFIHDPS